MIRFVIGFLLGAVLVVWFPLFMKALVCLIAYGILAAIAIFILVAIMGRKD